MIDLSTLPDAGPLDGTELVAMLQGGTWVKAPLFQAISLPAPVITAVPTSFVATAIDGYEIDLTWSSGTAFVLQRCRNNDGAWVTIYEGATAAYNDTDLYPDETYYYRVNDTGVGEFSSNWAITNETTLSPP